MPSLPEQLLSCRNNTGVKQWRSGSEAVIKTGEQLASVGKQLASSRKTLKNLNLHQLIIDLLIFIVFPVCT